MTSRSASRAGVGRRTCMHRRVPEALAAVGLDDRAAKPVADPVGRAAATTRAGRRARRSPGHPRPRRADGEPRSGRSRDPGRAAGRPAGRAIDDDRPDRAPRGDRLATRRRGACPRTRWATHRRRAHGGRSGAIRPADARRGHLAAGRGRSGRTPRRRRHRRPGSTVLARDRSDATATTGRARSCMTPRWMRPRANGSRWSGPTGAASPRSRDCSSACSDRIAGTSRSSATTRPAWRPASLPAAPPTCSRSRSGSSSRRACVDEVTLGLDPAERGRVDELMTRLGLPLDRFADRSPYRLSGGEQRRLSLAVRAGAGSASPRARRADVRAGPPRLRGSRRDPRGAPARRDVPDRRDARRALRPRRREPDRASRPGPHRRPTDRRRPHDPAARPHATPSSTAPSDGPARS